MSNYDILRRGVLSKTAEIDQNLAASDRKSQAIATAGIGGLEWMGNKADAWDQWEKGRKMAYSAQGQDLPDEKKGFWDPLKKLLSKPGDLDFDYGDSGVSYSADRLRTMGKYADYQKYLPKDFLQGTDVDYTERNRKAMLSKREAMFKDINDNWQGLGESTDIGTELDPQGESVWQGGDVPEYTFDKTLEDIKQSIADVRKNEQIAWKPSEVYGEGFMESNITGYKSNVTDNPALYNDIGSEDIQTTPIRPLIPMESELQGEPTTAENAIINNDPSLRESWESWESPTKPKTILDGVEKPAYPLIDTGSKKDSPWLMDAPEEWSDEKHASEMRKHVLGSEEGRRDLENMFYSELPVRPADGKRSDNLDWIFNESKHGDLTGSNIFANVREREADPGRMVEVEKEIPIKSGPRTARDHEINEARFGKDYWDRINSDGKLKLTVNEWENSGTSRVTDYALQNKRGAILYDKNKGFNYESLYDTFYDKHYVNPYTEDDSNIYSGMDI